MEQLSARAWRPWAALGSAILLLMLVGCSAHQAAPSDTGETEAPFSDSSRGLEPPSKLSPALQRLSVSGGDVSRDLSPDQAAAPGPDEVGYPTPETTDEYQVAIHVTPDVDLKALANAGAYIQMQLGPIIYASVHVRDLEQVADVDGVTSVAPMPAGEMPTPPKTDLQTTQSNVSRDLGAGTSDSLQFNHHGSNGRGVIVGIVDTGIDWRHPDFANPDGTTRIVALWDIFDNTWESSNHTVGSKPPMNWNGEGKPMGTVYTSDQINQAIKGQLKIPRTDSAGHGTACAGTAAGNGLGVAPDADLVIVNTYRDNVANKGNDGACALQAVRWITQVAAARHEPCVISLSFGTHETTHDGAGEEEQGFDEILKDGNAPGVVICASAGNEGQDCIHARGRFGPERPGELHQGFGEPVQLFVTKETILGVLLDSRDDWKVRIAGLDKFIFGTDGKPARLNMYKGQKTGNDDGLKATFSDNLSPADRNTLISMRHAGKIGVATTPNGTDALIVTLPPGAYWVAVAGNSAKVTHGVFDMYLPEVSDATFGHGGDHRMTVSAPGDADDLITVGSYDFRGEWENVNGTTTYCDQIDPGNISAYSNEGFRRDGAVKPDIAAPGEFTISAMAQGSALADEMGGSATVTRDGKHLAWAGTSASCPYTAGVVALMLQKNPQLTANQVKQILRDTADHDFTVTGAVPNGQWGYGKLNPDAAIAKVPAAAAQPPTTAPSPAPANAGFAGTFKGDGIVLVLVANGDGSYSGSMVRGGIPYPLMARGIGMQLEGTVTNAGQDYPFAAMLEGDRLTLRSGDKTYVLMRQDESRGFDSAVAGNAEQSRDISFAPFAPTPDLTLRPMSIDDPMINNWPAMTYLIPEGWRFQGSIHWNQDPFTMVSPVVLSCAPGGFPGVMIYPQGSYVAGIREQRMRIFGPQSAAWVNAWLGEGKLYMGKEIRIFTAPRDYISRFIISRYRPDLANARLVSVEEAPQFAKMYWDIAGGDQLPGFRVEAVKARFEYEARGRSIEEDIYCAVTALPTGGGVVAWTGSAISFAAEQAALDQNMPMLAAIVASAKPQLKWVNACMQVSQMMRQNIADATAREGALSRYIAQVSDQISAMRQQAYDERCRVQDRVAEQWHQYIAGVETYAGANGPIELPNNGSEWYVDVGGSYHQVRPGGRPDPSWTHLAPYQQGVSNPG